MTMPLVFGFGSEDASDSHTDAEEELDETALAQYMSTPGSEHASHVCTIL